jgi:hypothetical protein
MRKCVLFGLRANPADAPPTPEEARLSPEDARWTPEDDWLTPEDRRFARRKLG